MKILIISHMYLSSFNNITLFTHRQVREIKKLKNEVIVISPVPYVPLFFKYLSKKWKNYAKAPKKMILDNIKIYYPHYLALPKGLLFSYSGTLMYYGIQKTITRIYKNFEFDIIHAHVALPDGYAGMLLAKKYKKPLIVTIHGQDLQQTIYRNKKCRENIKKVINFSKKTILVSDKLKNISINKLGINFRKLTVIPNGINMEDLYNSRNPLAEKYANKKIILSVSNLIKTKGIDYNIKAFSQLIKKYPNLIYLIIGDGSEKNNLKGLTKELKIENHVKFLGKLPHNKVIEYISICDIFSLPSWNEGFGVVYLEAMINGKPVIAVKGQGIDGIIQNKKNGLLIEPKNTVDLIKALDFLISSPEFRNKIAQEGKNNVLKNYTWKKISTKINKIYKNI